MLGVGRKLLYRSCWTRIFKILEDVSDKDISDKNLLYFFIIYRRFLLFADKIVLHLLLLAVPHHQK